jgi:hypothetical protein
MTEQTALGNILALQPANLNLCVCLASYIGKQDVPTLAALSMTTALTNQFRHIVTVHLETLRAGFQNGDALLRPYDAGYKPDGHEIEWIKSDGMQEISDSLECVPDPVINAPAFTGEDAFIAGLHFYVIVLGDGKDRTLFFRKYDPKKELSRSKWFGALLRNGTYDRISQTAFLFDDQIDCMARSGYLFSTHRYDFQQIFGFFAKIREKAEECIGKIAERVPIADFETFKESCSSHLHKLAKLVNIAAKPYLATVTMKDLKKTIKQFNLGVKVVKEDGVEKLKFDPADRWIILKLLDDDYLGSVMTKIQFEVNSKREVAAAGV